MVKPAQGTNKKPSPTTQQNLRTSSFLVNGVLRVLSRSPLAPTAGPLLLAVGQILMVARSTLSWVGTAVTTRGQGKTCTSYTHHFANLRIVYCFNVLRHSVSQVEMVNVAHLRKGTTLIKASPQAFSPPINHTRR